MGNGQYIPILLQDEKNWKNMDWRKLLIVIIKFIFINLFIFLPLFLLGCQNVRVGETSLQKPTTLAPSSKPLIVGEISGKQLEYLYDMYKRIDIKYLQGVGVKDYSSRIIHCLSFLVGEYGPSIYKGKVNLIISANSRNSGKMSWSDNRRKYRTITLNELCLLPSELRILVHELFHAFYQSNAFIKANPDFILEGMAVYTENKYRYGNKSNAEILKQMRQEFEVIARLVEYKPINFDIPFQSYGNKKIDLFYILSGILFFSQDPTTINGKIRKIFKKSPTSGGKKSFDELIEAYRLKKTEPFLEEMSTIALQLPEPQKAKKGKQHYIQIGFYSKNNKKVAGPIAKYYTDLGFKAEIIQNPQKPGWLLLIGPYSNKIEANKVVKRLKEFDETPPDIFTITF